TQTVGRVDVEALDGAVEHRAGQLDHEALIADDPEVVAQAGDIVQRHRHVGPDGKGEPAAGAAVLEQAPIAPDREDVVVARSPDRVQRVVEVVAEAPLIRRAPRRVLADVAVFADGPDGPAGRDPDSVERDAGWQPAAAAVRLHARS